MKVIYFKDNLKLNLPPSIATIGFFDGVHIGHKYLINHLIKEADNSCLKSMVITFDTHPRQILDSDYKPQLLSTFEEKITKLQQFHVDFIIVLHFDKKLSLLSSNAFMLDILKRKLNISKLLVGYDNHFGHDSSNTFSDYAAFGKNIGIDVIKNVVFSFNGVNISSSVIRRLLLSGNVAKAIEYLDEPYSLTGKVVYGCQNGNKIGFPTANIDISKNSKLLPALGVYAVLVYINNEKKAKSGMLNIGYRPSFSGKTLSIEVNVFNYNGNLYGKTIKVDFIHYIRKEKKFNSIDSLIFQLNKDRKEIAALLNQDTNI